MRAPHYAGIRTVVLGASGFLGGHVARTLVREGGVVVLVIRDAARAEGLRRELGAAATLVVSDLTVAGAIGDVLARHRPGAVFNMTAFGVDPSERDEFMSERINVDLPAEIAEAMAESGDRSWPGQQVVHVGSALEYGTASGDLHEQTPCTPTTLYGRTKLAGTERLADTGKRLGVRTVTGRLFTVYGPGEGDGRLLPTLLAAARTTDPIRLSAGLQLRDFTFADDATEGLLRLGALPAPDLGVVNIATGRLTTVREFTEVAADVLGIAKARLEFGALPTRAEEMRHDPVRIRRLAELTGWTPARAIRDGIERTRDAR